MVLLVHMQEWIDIKISEGYKNFIDSMKKGNEVRKQKQVEI